MSDDDDSLPHSGSFASLPRSPARSRVQILEATGSFASSEGDVSGGRSSRSVSSLAASDDDGLGTELSGLQRVSEELHKEIADVSTEDIDILVPDDDGELPKTPSRTLVIGIIPESDESGGSNDETKSTPDRLVDTYTSDVATPLRTGSRDNGSSSGSRSASSGDSAIDGALPHAPLNITNRDGLSGRPGGRSWPSAALLPVLRSGVVLRPGPTPPPDLRASGGFWHVPRHVPVCAKRAWVMVLGCGWVLVGFFCIEEAILRSLRCVFRSMPRLPPPASRGWEWRACMACPRH